MRGGASGTPRAASLPRFAAGAKKFSPSPRPARRADGLPTQCQEAGNSAAARHPQEAATPAPAACGRSAAVAPGPAHRAGGARARACRQWTAKRRGGGGLAAQVPGRCSLTGRHPAVPWPKAKATGIATFFVKRWRWNGAFVEHPPEPGMRAESPQKAPLVAQTSVSRQEWSGRMQLHASRAERHTPEPPRRELTWEGRPPRDAGTHLAALGPRPRGESVNGETAV